MTTNEFEKRLKEIFDDMTVEEAKADGVGVVPNLSGDGRIMLRSEHKNTVSIKEHKSNEE